MSAKVDIARCFLRQRLERCQSISYLLLFDVLGVDTFNDSSGKQPLVVHLDVTSENPGALHEFVGIIGKQTMKQRFGLVYPPGKVTCGQRTMINVAVSYHL